MVSISFKLSILTNIGNQMFLAALLALIGTPMPRFGVASGRLLLRRQVLGGLVMLGLVWEIGGWG